MILIIAILALIGTLRLRKRRTATQASQEEAAA